MANQILNNFLQMIGGQTGFNSKLNSLGQECKNKNIDPETQIRNMLNSGQISQEAFNQAAMLANMLTGRK